MIAGSKLLMLGLFGALAVHALPEPAKAQVTAAPKLEERATSCTFSGSAGASSASKSKTACATIVLSAVAVPSGTTLDLTGLNDGTTVIFEGETTFGYKEWSGPLVSVSGTDITVKGASGATLNGDGSRWWDGKGSNGGKTKPKFFYAHKMFSSTISDIHIVNSPVQVFSINGATDLTLSGITVDNRDGDTDEGGHNTDAFDVGSSTGITITGATVYNQDDCLAVNSGTDITFTGGLCSGGHGLSIGSVGGRSNNDVANVIIENSQIQDSTNGKGISALGIVCLVLTCGTGVRIKTVYEATGSVKNVTYKDITLSGITKYGIVIEQDYENGSPTGTPTDGVPITDLTLDGVKGTVASSGTNVYILCAEGACSDWTWDGVSVSGGKTSSACENVPSSASC
ncbi:unnamed protein product [Penicillium olsonii]|uniref:endo-polygalacturonase n=1 Tax=Penicillium olsonii TaxID=99116 RepID=A0A9W4MQH7_PENOL|nr:unnamed protein product [Penicillium olsonii]CAG8031266.1 unnamed protein product [Penicillium olsonii]